MRNAIEIESDVNTRPRRPPAVDAVPSERMSPDPRQTLTNEQLDIITRVEGTMFYLAGDTESQCAWLEWQIDEMLNRVSLDDFTPSELVAFVGLVGPIFSRVLTRQARPSKRAHWPPTLRLV